MVSARGVGFVSQVSRRALLSTAGLALPAAALSACGAQAHQAKQTKPSAGTSGPSSNAPSSPSATVSGRTGVLRSADLLVFAPTGLSDAVIDRVRRSHGVQAVLPITMSQVSIQDQLLVLASVDPSTYRNFTPMTSADDERIWERVAGGELAVDPTLRQTLPADDIVRLGASANAPTAHIGAWAPQIADAIHLVGNASWAGKLGMQSHNGLLVSTGITSPDRVVGPVQAIVGKAVSVQRLDVVAREGLDPQAVQTAYVVGSVADAVGHYTYSVAALSDHGDLVTPDPSWVKEHVVTDSIPIIGPVTGNKLFFPQLKAAMGEVVDRGLAHTIIKSEYGGCYFPRFIAGTHVLSNHAFGLAIDLNVAQNQRGTPGQMDRSVVQIFNRWGFTWGGTWAYTDPMHFEINRLVSPGSVS